MASLVLRRTPSALSSRALASSIPHARSFSSTPAAFVKPGTSIPEIEVQEGSPGNKISLAKELAKGKGLIVGVPAAFSPACSSSHIPGYINSPKLKDAGSVFVVSVNDAFVMEAWKKDLDPSGKSGIRFIADPAHEFTDALDVGFENKAVFGGTRGKRYALIVEDGKVKEAHVEPDNTGLNVSAADKVLK